MRILITGGAGLVARALASAYAGDDVCALTHRELDIADAAQVHDVVARVRPDVVFNCAVIGVDDCEADPPLAQRVNVEGPELLARVAARVVHFSTNYVFDGERTDGVPYDVDDEARPVNVYGATKLRGERAVLAASPHALVVRTSWVFGAGKASFLGTAGAKLRRGERIAAITDTFASATYVEDLAARVKELVASGARGVHHVVNDGVLSYEMFGLEAARLVGADESLIERVAESRTGSREQGAGAPHATGISGPRSPAPGQRTAPRPRWTPMRCRPAMRRWQEALAEYLAVLR